MNATRVATIGLSLPDIRTVDLLSTANFAELDTIIWRPSILSTAAQNVDQQRRAFQRITQLDTWLRAGHNLMILAEPLPISAVNIGRTTTTVPQLPLLSNFVFREHSGFSVQACGPQIANEVFAPFFGQMVYTVVLEGPITPLVRVSSALPGPVQIVAGHACIDGGLILLVPPYALSNSNEASKYFLVMLSLMGILKSGKKSDKPTWVDEFRTNEEAQAYEAIEQAMGVIVSSNAAIVEQERKIDHYANLKELFFSTGENFRVAVAAGLAELGINVVDGPHPRADILGLIDGTVLAIEAKGLEGSAKEADLREVLSWKADVLHTLATASADRKGHPILTSYVTQMQKLGVDVGEGLAMPCKAIMVINAFRSTPPSERKDADFPPPMVGNIKLERVCALSGLQLYNLVMQARTDPNSKDQIKKTLLETEGVLESGRDWQTYLSKMDKAD